MVQDISNKKRMMFIKEDDYNYLTYNIFIILNGLDCTIGKSSLKDHRKLSFLIDFISDSKLIDIIERSINGGMKINEIDKELLNQSYTNSLLRIKTINQLIFTLSSEGFISVIEKKLDKLIIGLNTEIIDKEFLKGQMFSIERNNIKRLKRIVQRISIIDISNMLSLLYYNHGVIDEQVIN